jgi:hypothetical protein
MVAEHLTSMVPAQCVTSHTTFFVHLTNKKAMQNLSDCIFKIYVPLFGVMFILLFERENVLQWEEGDFIISDNLAVGHEATPETQLPRDVVGLRVLHRTTIKGTVPPAK